MFDEFIPPKVIVVDWGVILHKAAFAHKKQSLVTEKVSSPEKIMLGILLASLREIGINEKDTVIIALDSPGNWRKTIDSAYKANRKEARDKSGVDWDDIYVRSNKLISNLEESTPFHTISIYSLEADDIIATCVKRYSDRDVIAVTIDSDFYQLFSYKNFKFFSLNTKNYKKPVTNPYHELDKKIEKEVTDNLLDPITTKQEYDRRKLIVDLIHLPDFVEKKVTEVLDRLHDKCYNVDRLMGGDEKIRRRYDRIWNVGINYYRSINRNPKLTSTKIQPLF